MSQEGRSIKTSIDELKPEAGCGDPGLFRGSQSWSGSQCRYFKLDEAGARVKAGTRSRNQAFFELVRAGAGKKIATYFYRYSFLNRNSCCSF